MAGRFSDGTALAVLLAVFCLGLQVCSSVNAEVLPADRLDVMYHSFDGGGVTIDGPSVLVRKSVANKVSMSANYYVDTVSSASIDVKLGGSPYSEKRTEYTLGVDYLHDATIMSLGYTVSDENDFDAETLSFGVSQTFFGGLSTLSLGYSRGWDKVGIRDNDNFSADVDRHAYRLGLTQVISKSLVMNFAWDITTDEGFLNNPYRRVRYLDATSPTGFSLQSEFYPRTRTSNAAAVRAKYYLPYRAAAHAEVRYFSDTWDITAFNAELGYTHPWEQYIFDLRYRFYTQGNADFYSDLFPYRDAQSFMARDKELSSFNSHTLGGGVSYEFKLGDIAFLERATVNFYIDYIQFDYDDFRDATQANGTTVLAGQESLYNFDATVLRLFVSAFY